jgi:hypothetical protein
MYWKSLHYLCLILNEEGVNYISKVIKSAKLESLGGETYWSMRDKRVCGTIAQRGLLDSQMRIEGVCYE